MVYRKIPQYHFRTSDFVSPESGEFLKKNFYIALPQLPSDFDGEKVLFSVPNALELRVIQRSLDDDKEDIRSLYREGCFYFNERNEWILEARLHMQMADSANDATFMLRLPLSAPFVKDAKLGIYFDGTWIRFMKDGEVLNQNSGLDRFCDPSGEVFIDDTCATIKVAQVTDVTVTYREEASDISPAFFFPHGWNTSVGDVMSFSHDGVYHLLYLLDRRHHGSGPCGSHYICHLTTENLVDWYEQKPVVENTKPWMSCGTGTMLFHDGKYYMSYGLHTERYMNNMEKITPPFDAVEGEFRSITFNEVFQRGGLPAGATYSVSDNGIDFEPANVLFHSARNPSAYADENGEIMLYGGYGGDGVFTSTDFNKPFRVAKNHFDFVKNSVMKNTSECPAFFSWNGYTYLIVGFTGYFRTMKPHSAAFVDASAMGENIYDGLSVPMVAAFGENRRILAGWVKACDLGWGGVLMQRELIQEENGKLGMKWLPELAPVMKTCNLLTADDDVFGGVALEKYQSYYFEVTIDPKTSKRFGMSLGDGETACIVELDFEKSRLQINSAPYGTFAQHVPIMLEQMRMVDKNIDHYVKAGLTDIPQNAKNYALPDISGMDKPFKFKVMLRYSKRLHGTVIDAEIAERRTAISVRENFSPTELLLLKDGDLSVEAEALHKIDCVE